MNATESNAIRATARTYGDMRINTNASNLLSIEGREMTVRRYSAMHKDVWTDESGKYVRYEEYAALKSKMDMINDLMSAAEQANALAKEGVEALRKERDALAAENAGLKGFGEKLSEMRNDLNGTGTGIQGCHEAHVQQVAIEAAIEAFDELETPATGAAIANIQAQGVEMFAEFCRLKGEVRAFNFFNDAALNAEEFASQLRKESTHD